MTAIEIDELPDDHDQESVTALIERLKRAGHDIRQDRSGGFLASRWGQSRHCMDYESLQAFAKQLGVL